MMKHTYQGAPKGVCTNHPEVNPYDLDLSILKEMECTWKEATDEEERITREYENNGYKLYNINYGRKFSDAASKRLSESKKQYFANGGVVYNKGVPAPPEQRERLRKVLQEYYKTHPYPRGKDHPKYGKPISEEQRKKLSIRFSGKGNPMYGVHLKVSDETREKLRKINTGRIVSEETRKKLSLAKSGEKHHMYGKHHTDESRQKMSIGQRARYAKLDPASYSGENSVWYGRHHSEETKQKLSEIRKGSNNPMFGVPSPMTGKHHSEETLAKIRKQHKKFIDRRRVEFIIERDLPLPILLGDEKFPFRMSEPFTGTTKRGKQILADRDVEHNKNRGPLVVKLGSPLVIKLGSNW